jgi:hypothetical protein
MTTNFPSPTTPAPAVRRRVLWASTALTFALVLAGCGSSSRSSSNSTTVRSAAAGGAATTASSSSSSSAAASSVVPSAPSAPSAHAGGDYCSLITAAEARAVVGEDLKPGLSRTATTPKIGGESGSCLYKPAQTKVLTLVNLIVVGTKIPRSVFDTEIKSPDAGPTKPVSGLGETAFAVPGIVTVYDHGLVLALEILKGGNAVPTATLAAMLRTALGRAGGLR